jgi:hypothetical protein
MPREQYRKVSGVAMMAAAARSMEFHTEKRNSKEYENEDISGELHNGFLRPKSR